MRLREFIYNELCKNEMNQRELSKKSGVKESSVSRFFNDRACINVSTFLKMLDGLGIKMMLISPDGEARVIKESEQMYKVRKSAKGNTEEEVL